MDDSEFKKAGKAVSLYKLKDGNFLISCTGSIFQLKGNLDQIKTYLTDIGVESSELDFGLNELKVKGHNFCSFGVFGSFIYSEEKAISEELH